MGRMRVDRRIETGDPAIKITRGIQQAGTTCYTTTSMVPIGRCPICTICIH